MMTLRNIRQNGTELRRRDRVEHRVSNVTKAFSYMWVALIESILLSPVHANPTGGSVAQGSATITSAGSQLTVNSTTPSTYINWQTFNILLGQTTTFVQPSSSSVVWNHINDANPSQILGNLNANGYVILENQNGFYVGGQAAISTHGLVMSTAPIRMPDLSSSSVWQFNTPPPLAKIVNYGQINVAGGGPAFLIASDIQNNGTISAPGGKIGLYAGQEVLVSTSPDGRGLSAQVTLPQGSVDNEGKLIADAGSIVAQAKTVNQNGIVQANSVQNVNGVIELLASDSVALGANSVISAQGDSTGNSTGGSVTIKGGNSFSDTRGSTINIAGGAQGGNGGQLEISAANVSDMQSQIDGYAVAGFVGGVFTLDPYDLTINSAYASTFNGVSQINLQADHDITLSTLWTISDSQTAAQLTMTAGNNIILNNGSGIKAGNNWGLNLSAGPANLSAQPVTSRTAGIYLDGNSYLQTQNGSITAWAANELLINSGAIRTLAGGGISATAEFGDVNTGNNVNGYTFAQNRNNTLGIPYYTVNAAKLGGISTAAGGDVAINAGGNVVSYLPFENTVSIAQYANALGDAGTGAFGPQAGNVTINAAKNVYGHYVVANGTGIINAGGDVGMQASDTRGFALSLIKGSWHVNAPNGNIYVQDIRNPNAVFGGNGTFATTVDAYAGFHLADYDSRASVILNAGDSVEFTGYDAPHTPVFSSGPQNPVPMILPPSLSITAAGGDFTLDNNLANAFDTLSLFASPYQFLNVNIGRDFIGQPVNGFSPTLEMIGSASDPNSPVEINVGRDMRNVNLTLSKETHITVMGDVIDSGVLINNGLSSANTIHVIGNIVNSPKFVSALMSVPSSDTLVCQVNVTQNGVPTVLTEPWYYPFVFAIDPDALALFNKNNLDGYFAKQNASQLNTLLGNYMLFKNDAGLGKMPPGGFFYDPISQQLNVGYAAYSLTANQISALKGNPVTVLLPSSSNWTAPAKNSDKSLTVGTATLSFLNQPQSAASSILDSTLNTLIVKSQATHIPANASPGIQISGPGSLGVKASSIDLGSTAGILSLGGASLSVKVDHDLNMVSSSIASQAGGNVDVFAGGSINLSQYYLLSGGVSGYLSLPGDDCYGIYTSEGGNVSVFANGNINIGSSRIATFNGGDILVASYNGNVDLGNGANIALKVYGNGQQFGNDQSLETLGEDPVPYGSGILSELPTQKYWAPGVTEPGDITIITPFNITGVKGGLTQVIMNGVVGSDPSINLIAGNFNFTTGFLNNLPPAVNGEIRTPLLLSPSVLNAFIAGGTALGNTLSLSSLSSSGGTYSGLINLPNSVIVGGNVAVASSSTKAKFILSQHNVNVTSPNPFVGNILAGGTVSFSGGGSVSGNIVGIGGISVGDNATVSGSLFSANVSGVSGVENTLGTSVAASSASQSAATQATKETKQELASTTTGDDEDKKKKARPVLQRIKRVTVLLPKAS